MTPERWRGRRRAQERERERERGRVGECKEKTGREFKGRKGGAWAVPGGPLRAIAVTFRHCRLPLPADFLYHTRDRVQKKERERERERECVGECKKRQGDA